MVQVNDDSAMAVDEAARRCPPRAHAASWR